MSGTYLITTFKDKDKVKALGARWDPARRQWHVPPGRDLAPFAAWLPAGEADETPTESAQRALTTAEPQPGYALQTPPPRGVPLSRLLGGVAAAVSDAFPTAIWTTVEVVDVRMRGHVYLEVSERDAHGVVVAKANAVIWSGQAHRILPEFQQATGAELGPGIKLLVHARPVFKAQYGFSLEIDAIDASYTLGDLEARKREIRERLQAEGLWRLNQQLMPPWDYQHVLVVAPEGGAGLGDFQAEASRLERRGICRFLYVYSRFQGEGAAQEIRRELTAALEQIRANHPWLPDAVVILRGGGAVNDLAWLNDYALARCVCELPIPVLTGIGHERDNTVLDEVAHQRYDTPSKVIAGIERQIVQRAREAQALFEQLVQGAGRSIEQARRQTERWHQEIQAGARQDLGNARQRAAQWLATLHLEAVSQLRLAATWAQARRDDVRHLARQQLLLARRETPALLAEIRSESRAAVRAARAMSEAEMGVVRTQAGSELRHRRQTLEQLLAENRARAGRTLQEARASSQALLREIAGQGPEKTLRRGFALVRDPQGRAVTRASTSEQEVIIQFHDGQRAATLQQP